jgi:hypothetical protein
MYLVAKYKNGKHVGFIESGRPMTIRVYDHIDSARRGIHQCREDGIDLVIVKISEDALVPIDR